MPESPSSHEIPFDEIPADDVTAPPVRFGRWNIGPAAMAILLLAQLVRSVRQVLTEGGATPMGTAIRVCVAVAAAVLLVVARVAVELRSEGVSVRPWLLPRRLIPWRDVTDFRVLHVAAPRASQVIRYISLSSFDELVLEQGPRTSRVRIPERHVAAVRAYADAFFSVSKPASS